MIKSLIYKEDVIAKAWLDDECEVVSLCDIEEIEPIAFVSGILHVCPVCNGRMYVPGNFYDVPSQTISYADYQKKSYMSIPCHSCSGKGFIEIKKDHG